MTTLRQEFEAWAEAAWGASAYLHTNTTSGEWEAWQAAAASAEARERERVAALVPDFTVGWRKERLIAAIRSTGAQHE